MFKNQLKEFYKQLLIQLNQTNYVMEWIPEVDEG